MTRRPPRSTLSSSSAASDVYKRQDDIPVTNPNIFSFGKPGRGKSATTKAFCLRMMDFGYRTLILGDPKDEYEMLCRALGVEPVAIGHGLSTRINPVSYTHLTLPTKR